MSGPSRHCSRPAHARPALSMVETAFSVTIVGVTLVAALNTVAASRMTRTKIGDRSQGTLLAQDLMSEILQQAYADPDYGVDSFGLLLAEVGDGSRALFDDVDDYDGWSAAPPQQKDGTEMTAYGGWQRSVAVVWADPDELSQDVGGNQGAKRITVTVACDGVLVTTLTAVRTSAWSDPVAQGAP